MSCRCLKLNILIRCPLPRLVIVSANWVTVLLSAGMSFLLIPSGAVQAVPFHENLKKKVVS